MTISPPNKEDLSLTVENLRRQLAHADGDIEALYAMLIDGHGYTAEKIDAWIGGAERPPLASSARAPTVLKTEVGPVPNLYCTYLVDGKLYRVCACDPFSGPCANGIERKLLTCELSRCLIPDDSLYVEEKK